MYTYTFTSKDSSILTPFVDNLNDVKKEITQTPEYIINKSTYPNGFIIEMTQYSDRIEVKSNKELIDNGDGTYSVKL